MLDSCDVMVYVEDDEYWEQALARTEHFLFHKLRRLRPPANGAKAYGEDVFSLSADGERLMQRTYAETRAKYGGGSVPFARKSLDVSVFLVL